MKSEHPGEPVRILVVCTANQCRSPMTGALLQRALDRRGVAAEVSTAGFGSEGQRATSTTRAVAAARGIDLDEHRSRRYDGQLESADLVLGMERVHVRDAVVDTPAAWAKTFTLKELRRRAEAIGPRDPDEPFAAWLARVHEGRRSTDMLGSSSEDDVSDPTGGTKVEHEETLDALDDLVQSFVTLAWPPRA